MPKTFELPSAVARNFIRDMRAFFAEESTIHRGNLGALALPQLPPGLRERLTTDRQLQLARVDLLPSSVVSAALE